jgi:Stealth protein CR2, conserved region 2
VSERIDIVIPHVDGHAAGYEALYRAHADDWSPCHVRDLGELRYVLRSIALYAPFASVILAVQSESHVPECVDRRVVRVVTHDTFIPHNLLPTFHWATIFAHLHRIEGLSDRFVIWEDDVLAGMPLAPETFFRADGSARSSGSPIPIVPGLERFSMFGTYQLNLAHSARACAAMGMPSPVYIYPHMPLPGRVRDWETFHQVFDNNPVYRDTITRKSRGDERRRPTLDPSVCFANWCSQDVSFFRRVFEAPSVRHAPLVNDRESMRRHMQRLVRSRAHFININDEAYDGWPGDRTGGSLNPDSLSALTLALGARFPEASRFEKGPG